MVRVFIREGLMSQWDFSALNALNPLWRGLQETLISAWRLFRRVVRDFGTRQVIPQVSRAIKRRVFWKFDYRPSLNPVNELLPICYDSQLLHRNAQVVPAVELYLLWYSGFCKE